MKIFIKRVVACFCATLICSFSFLSTPKADLLEEAVLQTGSAAERQFWEKIKIIKSVFQNQVDDVALAATILYGGSSSDILQSEYDSNFDADSFKNQVDSIKDMSGSTSGKTSQGGDKTDVLLAALIVMIDSSMGKIDEDGNVSYDFLNASYSDDKYKHALAGSRLVGNMTNPENCTEESCDLGNVGANLINGAFCGFGAAFDAATAPLQAIEGLFVGDVVNQGAQFGKRFVTMPKVCSGGFIDATYDEIHNMNTDTSLAKANKQAAKDKIADGIIKLAQAYRELFNVEKEEECVASTSTGDYTEWKQFDDEWGKVSLGNDTVAKSGCLITAMAIQIARSGTAITNLPSGYSSFNPGALAKTINKNGGFESSGAFRWVGFESLAKNWKIGGFVSLSINNTSKLAGVLSKELSTTVDGKYQKYLLLKIHHSGSNQHWVAVDSVSGNSVTIFDPGSSKGNTLDNNYKKWVVDGYKVMYATDSNGSQNNTSSTDNSNADSSNDSSDEDTDTTNNVCGGSNGGSDEDIREFIAYVEGVSYCNYKGRGKRTGYKAKRNKGDKDLAGATTAFGITENNNKDAAKKVGYSSFVSDMKSGCTDKEYIDKMFPMIIDNHKSSVLADLKKRGINNLTDSQIDTLTSMQFNTGIAGGYVRLVKKIKQYGANSLEVAKCFFTNPCSWSRSFYNEGLANRRSAEFEVYSTGNYKAAKVEKGYNFFQNVVSSSANLEKYKRKYWPTSRK